MEEATYDTWPDNTKTNQKQGKEDVHVSSTAIGNLFGDLKDPDVLPSHNKGLSSSWIRALSMADTISLPPLISHHEQQWKFIPCFQVCVGAS